MVVTEWAGRDWSLVQCPLIKEHPRKGLCLHEERQRGEFSWSAFQTLCPQGCTPS